jgi:nitrous oxide reductase
VPVGFHENAPEQDSDPAGLRRRSFLTFASGAVAAGAVGAGVAAAGPAAAVGGGQGTIAHVVNTTGGPSDADVNLAMVTTYP